MLFFGFTWDSGTNSQPQGNLGFWRRLAWKPPLEYSLRENAQKTRWDICWRTACRRTRSSI